MGHSSRSRRQRRGKLDLLGLEDLARSRADRASGSRLYRGGHPDRRSTHVATPTLDMWFLVEGMKAKRQGTHKAQSGREDYGARKDRRPPRSRGGRAPTIGSKMLSFEVD